MVEIENTDGTTANTTDGTTTNTVDGTTTNPPKTLMSKFRSKLGNVREAAVVIGPVFTICTGATDTAACIQKCVEDASAAEI